MKQILVAGFGGQGILFAGKFLAYIGMIQDKEVSWLPSYGPEMRGGTANCRVLIPEEAVGSPIVSSPEVLICMNLPSLDKFEAAIVKRGKAFIDSSLIERKLNRADVEGYYLPATLLADQHELKGLANMIMVGKAIKETNLCDMDTLRKAVEKIVPASKPQLVELNMKAIEIGYNYQ